ncbi:MAG: hypothetical protein Q9167_000415 [Letrouitia subvulpina]
MIMDHFTGFMEFLDVERQSCGKAALKLPIVTDPFKDAARQKTNSMFRSLMLQILQQHSSVPDSVLAIYNGHEHEQPSEERMLKTFKSIIAKCKQLYIIIDALDECPYNDGERVRLVSLLGSFKDFNLPIFHILVTSRKEPDLVGIEKLVTFPPIGIQTGDVNSDILLHVRMQLCNDSKLCDWPQEMKDKIEIKLSRDAHGM